MVISVPASAGRAAPSFDDVCCGRLPHATHCTLNLWIPSIMRANFATILCAARRVFPRAEWAVVHDFVEIEKETRRN